MEKQTKDGETNLGIVGWVLFVIGMVLIILSIGGIISYGGFFFGPIFIATFIISIILLTKKKVASGLSLMLLTLILPPFLWFYFSGII